MLKNRLLYDQLLKHLDNKTFTILTGARQTGKTSLFKQLYAHLVKLGRKAFIFNLEDLQLRNTLNLRPENIFTLTGIPPVTEGNEALLPDQKLYVLLDEIQYLENPSNFLKLLYDNYGDSLKLIVTGSSAFYIDRKFNDSLAGRKRLFWLKTLNFEEFLHFKDADYLIDELNRLRNDPQAISAKMPELRVLFNEYLIYGGYPQVVLQPDVQEKIAILEEIRNSYVKRDMLESNISNDIVFMQLFKLLAVQSGSLVNRNELSVVLRIDNKTVDNYLYVMQKCFHIELLRPYTGNVRKEITKMPKVYFYDLGLRHSLLNRFEPVSTRDDRGIIVENYLFRRLTEIYSPDQLNFWRTSDNHEVDFVISEQFQKGKALEIKYDATILKPKKYELFKNNFQQFPLSYVSFVECPNTLDLMKI
jgi:uncharacterized protein